MNKMCNWILSIIGGEKKVILIDEIENGIHHTNQQKFWTMLFDLAKEFDIQIFATSHSAEMIKAFQEVATAHAIKGGYFDLTRHAKTGKILGIKTQLDTLSLKIEHKMNYRG
jgi:AAA15 family ATPase/GTPase